MFKPATKEALEAAEKIKRLRDTVQVALDNKDENIIGIIQSAAKDMSKILGELSLGETDANAKQARLR